MGGTIILRLQEVPTFMITIELKRVEFWIRPPRHFHPIFQNPKYAVFRLEYFNPCGTYVCI